MFISTGVAKSGPPNSPTIPVLFAHMFGRINSIDAESADIDGQIEARLAPFMWKTILDTRVLIAEDLGAAPTPLALTQVEC
jgi:hypothetical protein